MRVIDSKRAGGATALLTLIVILGTPVAGAAPAAKLTATIDANRSSASVTPYEYGMFIEPIGGLIARSLWAEMLDDRKFYYQIVADGKDPPLPISVEGRPGISYRKWRPIGGDDAVSMDLQNPYVGKQSARVVLEGATARGFGQGGLGIARGKRYTGHLLLSGDTGAKVQLTLRWGAGPDGRQVVALPAPTRDWQSVAFEFTAGADSTDAHLEITGTGTGEFRIWVI